MSERIEVARLASEWCGMSVMSVRHVRVDPQIYCGYDRYV